MQVPETQNPKPKTTSFSQVSVLPRERTMSTAARSARAAKRAKVPEVQVPEVPEVPEVTQVGEPFDPLVQEDRIRDALDRLFIHDEVPDFNIEAPSRERDIPFGFPRAHLAAVYFCFGPDSRVGQDATLRRDPIFINLGEIALIPNDELPSFLTRAATASEANNKLRRLRDLSGVRALLGHGDAVPAHAVLLIHTQYGLQVTYDLGHGFDPRHTVRISSYAHALSASTAPLTSDELAAKVARWAQKPPEK